MIVNRRKGMVILLEESLPSMIILFGWDIVIVYLFMLYHQEWMEQPALPISLIGSALVLFMNVRNNAAYNRWWEGRSLWGMITNNCRSFGRQVASFLNNNPELAMAMAAYAHALRGSLSRLDTSADIKRLLPADMYAAIENKTNLPNAILFEVGQRVRQEAEKGNIDGAVLGQIDRILSDIANAQGGLERIRNTPLPMQFSILPKVLAHGFCIVLPFSMVQTLGWITPLGSSVVGFLYVALDKIGNDLESPFELTPHALPMQTITRNIEIDLLQGVEVPVAGPITPADGILP